MQARLPCRNSPLKPYCIRRRTGRRRRLRGAFLFRPHRCLQFVLCTMGPSQGALLQPVALLGDRDGGWGRSPCRRLDGPAKLPTISCLDILIQSWWRDSEGERFIKLKGSNSTKMKNLSIRLLCFFFGRKSKTSGFSASQRQHLYQETTGKRVMDLDCIISCISFYPPLFHLKSLIRHVFKLVCESL